MHKSIYARKSNANYADREVWKKSQCAERSEEDGEALRGVNE